MTKTIQLSKRLQAIADMVTPGNRVADIGTDHGHLPIWLLQSGRVPFAIGMDVRQGPLEHANQNMLHAGVSEKMVLRLSDGLEALTASEADTIVISGMGGMLIRSILINGYQKTICAKELILSPQSDIPIVRQYLRRNGFMIIDETVITDAGKYYTVLKAVPKADPSANDPNLTKEDRYGPVLMVRRPEAFLKMLSTQSAINAKIIDQLASAPDTKQNQEKAEFLCLEQEEIQSILQPNQTGERS